jgi:MFS family permease
VALLVYTYERGGTFGVGLLGVARTLPTLIGVPLASTLADRHSRIRVMLGCYLVALATAAVAAIALAADAPLLIVLVIAAVNAVATTAIRPLQNTIIPSLARSPEELVAANVATSTGEGIGVLVGPGLGGILMVFGPAVVAVAGAVGMVLATTAFTQIRDRPVRLRPSANAVGHPGRQPSRSNFVAGVAALRSLPTPFLVMAVFGVQPFVRGVLTVLIVAASIELLGLGDPGVGLLNAAIGAGAIIGAVATILLIGRARLAMVFLGALALWGAPISVVGLLPVAWVAVVAMGVIGSANAVLDVAGFTTLQRTIPNDIRASVLGLFEGYVAAMTGLGGLAAPVLLAVFGIEGALIVTGAILPVLAVLSSRFLVRVDDIALVPERQLRLLRGVAMFAPLPITTIEQLADNLVPVRFVAGEILMRAGDPGDRFILIETGTVEVEQDGATIRSIGPGGSVGEIALLRGVPRTATVRAATDVRAFALESASFIAAVTGDRDAAGFADRVVDARLANAEASTSRS